MKQQQTDTSKGIRAANQACEEGTWFAVPLCIKGYAVGLVARAAEEGGILYGYFFGPQTQQIPRLEDLAILRPQDAIESKLFDNDSLLDGTWPRIGKHDKWDRNSWPMLGFVKRDPIMDTIRIVQYHEFDLFTRSSETVVKEEPVGLPYDGFSTDTGVVIRLTYLLDSEYKRSSDEEDQRQQEEVIEELVDVPMNVTVKEYEYDIPFKLLYRREYEEFDTEPFERCMYGTSLMINDLELQLDEKAKVRLVAGCAPLSPHEKTENCPSRIEKGSIYFSFDPRRVAAQTHPINENGPWPLYINEKRGWICIGDPEVKDRRLVEFAPDAVATVVNSKIVALWLCPEFID